jgi:hypothetical protein
MKICVIIPDRGDRPKFMENCIRMMKNQTIQPDEIIHANWQPKTNKCDITERYRVSYESATQRGIFDFILFIENDDFYCTKYIETMCEKWISEGKPDMLGTSYTIYYNINKRASFVFNHLQRASAMNTLIVPGLPINWSKIKDHDPYTDLFLWMRVPNLKRIIFTPKSIISIGIKHGVGMPGGIGHVDHFEKFINPDPNFDFLKTNMDSESFNFYSTL